MLICTTVGGKLDFVLDPVAVYVAAGIDGLQRRPGKPNTHGRQFSVVDGAHPWRTAAQFDAE
ncbi:hypothetical protein D9M71_633830 [compost metagenome]